MGATTATTSISREPARAGCGVGTGPVEAGRDQPGQTHMGKSQVGPDDAESA